MWRQATLTRFTIYSMICAVISPTEEVEEYCRNILTGRIPPRMQGEAG